MTTFFDDLPKSIRIGPHDYKIETYSDEKSKELDEKEVYRFGEIIWIDQKIELNPKIASKSMVRDTLLHEMTHAIIAPLCLPPRDDERVAQAVGTGLAAVFRDNPELIEWIMERKKNGCDCADCKCKAGNAESVLFGKPVHSV